MSHLRAAIILLAYASKYDGPRDHRGRADLQKNARAKYKVVRGVPRFCRS